MEGRAASDDGGAFEEDGAEELGTSHRWSMIREMGLSHLLKPIPVVCCGEWALFGPSHPRSGPRSLRQWERLWVPFQWSTLTIHDVAARALVDEPNSTKTRILFHGFTPYPINWR
ncbi:hypothetical protein SDJN03_07424, partial [Cucurbita argyrosperma subsp. sororia]